MAFIPGFFTPRKTYQQYALATGLGHQLALSFSAMCTLHAVEVNLFSYYSVTATLNLVENKTVSPLINSAATAMTLTL